MIELAIIIVILMPAIILHEYAHGWTANRLGDPTAKDAGRLTLNPLKHIDPVGTLLVPGILIALRMLGTPIFVIGWAKPVPVNFMRLRQPRRDMVLVAMAGPLANLVIILILALIYRQTSAPLIQAVCQIGVFINLLLAVFNMIPIPPLDGSRLVMGILPRTLAVPYARLEPYGILIVCGLIYLNLLDVLIFPTVVKVSQWLGVPTLL